MKKLFVVIIAAASIAACTKWDDIEKYGESGEYDYAYESDGGVAPGSNQGQGGESGVVTAAEWNDLDNWSFWSNLAAGSFKTYLNTWGFNTSKRVAVEVKKGEAPVCGAKVAIIEDGALVWTAVTDNQGRADCWIDPFDMSEEGEIGALQLSINSEVCSQVPQISWPQDSVVTLNTYNIAEAAEPAKAVDIAFIVDATGSMMDEIAFLKSDLTDIIAKVKAEETDMAIRTAAVFYRDEDDEYVTKVSNFTENLDKTSTFISEQTADGGGDFPEAVHSALAVSLQNLDWKEDCRARLAFMLLDARAHKDAQIISSLHNSIKAYAAKGIKLIPVAASGVDKDTEAMCRVMDIFTGGTYVFITNDSGVGNDHIEASVGDYQVEKLNTLIIRLITHYSK